MPGSYVPHGGGRSEILADYLFSAWGTVNPVRWTDDYGVDLFCTLADVVNKRAIVREYFTVQVKSNQKPWTFPDPDAVNWLVRYPTPLFLATVDKTNGLVRIYHVMARFYLWALGSLPDTLDLGPEEETEDGKFLEWSGGNSYSLSAPILEVGLPDLTNQARMDSLREVFQRWVEFDRENCDLVRSGVLRFRMPVSYKTNQVPSSGIGELGSSSGSDFLKRGLTTLAESAEFMGGQLYNRGDISGAIKAILLVRHLLKQYPASFQDIARWRGGSIPGDLGLVVADRLNSLAARLGYGASYVHLGADTIANSLENDPLVKEFINTHRQVSQ